ncbi:MAG TPA: hypothetical protein VHS56_00815, partial [Candidatus Cybelea sp.]|nr:hypothetical protein [Candidatus Cybelea sp.]
IAAVIRDVAGEYCGGAVGFVLEGGYGIDALTNSIAAIASICDGAQPRGGVADATSIPFNIRRPLDNFLGSQEPFRKLEN